MTTRAPASAPKNGKRARAGTTTAQTICSAHFAWAASRSFWTARPSRKRRSCARPTKAAEWACRPCPPPKCSTPAAFSAGRGAQLLAHCNGDGAAELFLDALERLSPAARANCRPVLIHGQILGDDQLERIKRLGVIPSFFVAHVREFGDTHLKNLGEARGMRISPTRSALVRDIPFTLHQDAPVCEPDPLEAVACAVLRTTKAGKRLAGQEISVSDALRAVTEHAAAQYGFFDRGRIAAGLRADFVILNRDPLACNAEDLPGLRVVETYLKGRRVYPQNKNIPPAALFARRAAPSPQKTCVRSTKNVTFCPCGAP